MKKSDFVFTWFTDYHSPILTFFAKIYSKPIYSVIGGYEVEYLPQLNYGGIKNPFRKKAIQYSLNRATTLFPVSDYTKKRTRELIHHSRIHKIYNGIEIDPERKMIKKENALFLTVAHIEREQNLYIKGIPRFFSIAKAFPSDPFVLIGGKQAVIESYLGDIPSNVEIIGFQSRDALDSWYKKTCFYVQLSEVESFGLAVLEALSWGAVPIVSNRGALPELYSEVGIVMDLENFENELKNLPQKLQQIRNQHKIKTFIRRFDIQRRYKQLTEFVLNP